MGNSPLRRCILVGEGPGEGAAFVMAKPRVTRQTMLRARQLRSEMTPAERTLWSRVRAHRLDNLPIRRQHPIGPYVVDFCCQPAKVIIEVDGPTHFEPDQAAFDKERTLWLESQGYDVLRFTNEQIHNNLASVLQAIVDACGAEQ